MIPRASAGGSTRFRTINARERGNSLRKKGLKCRRRVLCLLRRPKKLVGHYPHKCPRKLAAVAAREAEIRRRWSPVPPNPDSRYEYPIQKMRLPQLR
jgi:hypothetical protein